ncbi:hypothetical protein [Nonomuraea rosea]
MTSGRDVVARILEFTGVTDRLPAHGTVEQAVQAAVAAAPSG